MHLKLKASWIQIVNFSKTHAYLRHTDL